MSPIRVLLADDHDLFRRGLAEVLEEEEDIEVVGQARDGREAVDKDGKVQSLDANFPSTAGYVSGQFP